MARSAEYPNLTFVEPKAWNKGRPYGPPLWIVCHTTEGTEGKTSAEAGAAFDARRTDGTSTHYFHDEDTTIQCVLTSDRANAAKGTGNHFGIHHELCGRAAQTPAQWDDAASQGTIEHFAKQAARDAKKWGIPVRLLTVEEVRAKKKGFCEHNTISKAFGESDHTDPGRNYPWDETLKLVRYYMSGDVLDMDEKELRTLVNQEVTKAVNAALDAALDKWPTKKAHRVNVGNAVWNTDDVIAAPGNPTSGNTHNTGTAYLQGIMNALVTVRQQGIEDAVRDTSLAGAVAAISGGGSAEEEAQRIATVLAPLLPAATEEQLYHALKRLLADLGAASAPQ